MRCPRGCSDMMAGALLWVCGHCGARRERVPPPTAPPPTLTPVPEGPFLFGSDEAGLRPMELDAYRIGVAPVTNGQYRVFVEETGADHPAHWRGELPCGEPLAHPVVFVNWHDALAYCGWLSGQTSDRIGLPSEAQWEKAARGGLWLAGEPPAGATARPNPAPERRFPWAGATGRERANYAGRYGGTTEVGRFPGGASPYGCLDLAGNVSEWCLDATGTPVLKGGSWRSEAAHIMCSNRYPYPAGTRGYGVGFRVVAA